MHQCHIVFALLATVAATCAVPLQIGTNDVVAWVGGSDVASARDAGHLATFFSICHPGARFRNFGWEGDTVFAQPRDVNFPPMLENLKRAGATAVLLQYGRAEALAGDGSVERFRAAYDRFAHACAVSGMRVTLITPAPFEAGGGMLPDLKPRNRMLAANARAIRSLGAERNWPVIDAFSILTGKTNRLTVDGLNLTPRGHAWFAMAVAEPLGCTKLTMTVNANGTWQHDQLEELRLAVIEKERLWFNYWRPQNWAFLGGDRVSQPSSRDHRNPNIRWFPAEMETYVPMIDAQERQIEKTARSISKGSL